MRPRSSPAFRLPGSRPDSSRTSARTSSVASPSSPSLRAPSRDSADRVAVSDDASCRRKLATTSRPGRAVDATWTSRRSVASSAAWTSSRTTATGPRSARNVPTASKNRSRAPCASYAGIASTPPDRNVRTSSGRTAPGAASARSRSTCSHGHRAGAVSWSGLDPHPTGTPAVARNLLSRLVLPTPGSPSTSTTCGAVDAAFTAPARNSSALSRPTNGPSSARRPGSRRPGSDRLGGGAAGLAAAVSAASWRSTAVSSSRSRRPGSMPSSPASTSRTLRRHSSAAA
nr:hypothetical protein [Microbispora sp. GKU 823]